MEQPELQLVTPFRPRWRFGPDASCQTSWSIVLAALLLGLGLILGALQHGVAKWVLAGGVLAGVLSAAMRMVDADDWTSVKQDGD